MEEAGQNETFLSLALYVAHIWFRVAAECAECRPRGNLDATVYDFNSRKPVDVFIPCLGYFRKRGE